MEIQRYNRLKAANERVQSVVHLDSAEREQARTQFKIVLAEKERTGTWLSEQMGHNFFDKRVQSRTRSSYAERRKSRTQFNISTVFTLDDQPLGPLGRLPKQESAAIRGTARLCRLPEQELYEIARLLDVDVKELLVSSKNIEANVR